MKRGVPTPPTSIVKCREALVTAISGLREAYRDLAKAYIEEGMDQEAADALAKLMKITAVVRGRS